MDTRKKEYTLEIVKWLDYDLIRKMRLRDDDVREICCVNNAPESAERAAELIADDCMRFPFTYLCRCNGEPFAVVGTVMTNHHSIRTVWCVGTDLITTGGMELLSWSQKVVSEMFTQAPILENFVDSRNKTHVKWLRCMGFTFTGVTASINGVIFKHFAKVRGDDNV